MTDYVFRDGARLTPAMLFDLEAFNLEYKRTFNDELLVTSGIRTRQEQTDIFTSRYVPASQVNGRRVYDYRWWDGVLWARVSPSGTVAVPDSSSANHVLENTGKGAVDLRDTGADAGIASSGNVRSNWARANASRYNYSPEGYLFGEAWHYKYMGDPWRKVPATAGQVSDDDLKDIKEVIDMGDARIVSYNKKGPREGIRIGTILGGFRGITGEQWGNEKVKELLKGIPVIQPTNDREYDIVMDLLKK